MIIDGLCIISFYVFGAVCLIVGMSLLYELIDTLYVVWTGRNRRRRARPLRWVR